jgi:hypothetical protein
MIALEVEFLPVGEKSRAGDAISIRYGAPNNFELIVIDGGTTASGEALMAHLNSLCAARPIVRDLIITHPDLDHSSGARVVLEQADVRNVWTHVPWWHADEILQHLQDPRWTADGLARRLKADYDVIAEIVATALARSIPVHEPFAGSTIGPFTVLSPSRQIYPQLVAHFPDTPQATGRFSDVAGQDFLKSVLEGFAKSIARIWEAWGVERLRDGGQTGARNESSVVLYGQFEGRKPILLTGDAGNLALGWAASFAEALGLPLREFGMVQVPHHGSRRNVGPTILNRLIGPIVREGQPPHFTAIVSAPKDDSDHPRKIVRNAFLRRGACLLATQGVPTFHGSGFPQRAGYGPATPLSFSFEVEAYDDE